MKVLRWCIGITCVCAVVLVLLTVILSPVLHSRQAELEPWDPETLAKLGVVRNGEEDTSSKKSIAETVETETHEDLAIKGDSPSESISQNLSRLAGRPTEADLDRHCRYSSLWDRALTRVYMAGLKRVESVLWMGAPDSADRYLLEIGHESFSLGDYDTAKKYLREALRNEERDFWRGHICSELAWLEEDPEIAAALLRESCADDNPHRLREAMHLAIITDSDDLADHYFERWANTLGDDEFTDWFKLGSVDPRVQAWKRERQAE